MTTTILFINDDYREHYLDQEYLYSNQTIHEGGY